MQFGRLKIEAIRLSIKNVLNTLFFNVHIDWIEIDCVWNMCSPDGKINFLLIQNHWIKKKHKTGE